MDSYFKYEIDIKHGESNELRRGLETISDYNKSSPLRNQGNNQFFIKPRLIITELIKHQVELDAKGEDTDEETFDVWVWTIRIKNNSKWHKIIEGCSALLKVSNVSPWIELRFLSRLGLSRKCIVTGTVEKDASGSYTKDYLARLAFCYTMDLVKESIEKVPMPKGKSDDLLFLVTVRERNIVHIITPNGHMGWFDKDNLAKQTDEAFLIFEIPSQHEIYLKIKNIEQTFKFKLEIISYDDIRLTKA